MNTIGTLHVCTIFFFLSGAVVTISLYYSSKNKLINRINKIDKRENRKIMADKMHLCFKYFPLTFYFIGPIFLYLEAFTLIRFSCNYETFFLLKIQKPHFILSSNNGNNDNNNLIRKPINIHCVKSVRIRSFFGPYFPAFELNMERYSVSLCI